MRTRGRNGITLIELIVAIGMLSILSVTVVSVYNLFFKSWNEGYSRSVIRGQLSQALESVAKRLIQAQSIDTLTESSVTFTADLGSGSATYRLYLYNEDDPEPNPPYTQDIYSLRFAQDTVNYGDGVLLSSDIARPISPVFTISDRVISVNLTARRGSQEVTMRTNIRPRNL